MLVAAFQIQQLLKIQVFVPPLAVQPVGITHVGAHNLERGIGHAKRKAVVAIIFLYHLSATFDDELTFIIGTISIATIDSLRLENATINGMRHIPAAVDCTFALQFTAIDQTVKIINRPPGRYAEVV